MDPQHMPLVFLYVVLTARQSTTMSLCAKSADHFVHLLSLRYVQISGNQCCFALSLWQQQSQATKIQYCLINVCIRHFGCKTQSQLVSLSPRCTHVYLLFLNLLKEMSINDKSAKKMKNSLILFPVKSATQKMKKKSSYFIAIIENSCQLNYHVINK